MAGESDVLSNWLREGDSKILCGGKYDLDPGLPH